MEVEVLITWKSAHTLDDHLSTRVMGRGGSIEVHCPIVKSGP